MEKAVTKVDVKKNALSRGKAPRGRITTYQAVYQAGTVAVTPMVLYAYYQNPGGIMKSPWSPKRMHTLEAFEQQIAFAQSRGEHRLLKKASEQYLFSSYDQLGQAQVVFARELRKKLRSALKLATKSGSFRPGWKTMWAYEAAYPCKPVWWLLSKSTERRRQREPDHFRNCAGL